jgi:hypothetical protein
MAADATRITVAQMARVWLAPVGTTAPDGPVAVMGVGWFDVGYFTPDSLQFATSPAFQAVQSHQSAYRTRSIQTEDAATLQVNLQEWSAANFKAVYGGGTIAAVTPSGGGTEYYKFTPPALGGRGQVAAVVEINDGTVNFRRVIPRAEQTEGVTIQLQKTQEATLPLRLSVLGSDVAAAWYDMTDSPAFDPAP